MSDISSDSLHLPSDEDEVHIQPVSHAQFRQVAAPAQSLPGTPGGRIGKAESGKKYYQRLEGAPVFVERFEKGLERTDRKREEWREERERKEMKECTFAPKLVAKQSSTHHQTLPEMYSSALLKAQHFQDLREAAQEHERLHLGPFRPTLNPKSLQLAQNSRNTPDLFTYLHTTKTTEKSRNTYKEPTHSFRPAINQKSAEMQRTQNIEDLLMEDARKRKERIEHISPLKNTEKLISSQSEKVLVDKFTSEFKGAIGKITSEEVLTKTQVYAVLRELQFIRMGSCQLVEEMWEYLNSGQQQSSLSSQVLLCFLLSLQRLPSPSPFSPHSLRHIQHTFHPLYTTRQQIRSRSTLNPTYKFTLKYPFQPDISKKTYFMEIPQTERVSLKRNSEVEMYFQAKQEEIGVKVKQGQTEGRGNAETILGKYIQIAQETVRKPQDRNEALFRLAAVQQRGRSSSSLE